MNSKKSVEEFIKSRGEIVKNIEQNKSTKAIIYREKDAFGKRREEYTFISMINNGVFVDNSTILVGKSSYKIKAVKTKYVCGVPLYIKAVAKKGGRIC